MNLCDYLSNFATTPLANRVLHLVIGHLLADSDVLGARLTLPNPILCLGRLWSHMHHLPLNFYLCSYTSLQLRLVLGFRVILEKCAYIQPKASYIKVKLTHALSQQVENSIHDPCNNADYVYVEVTCINLSKPHTHTFSHPHTQVSHTRVHRMLTYADVWWCGHI